MEELNLSDKLKNILLSFVQRLKNIYEQDLISVVLYGSAASGEFTQRHSNINLLVVLNSVSLENLNKVSGTVNKGRFRILNPVFFTEDYIASSNDVFPIEFLDIKENYVVLHGKDVLKDVSVDTRNLRFQCEQELKAKLISLRQLYLRKHQDKIALLNLLFKSFTSIMHILRNVLRIKGKQPPYLKQDILNEVAADFQIDKSSWDKILGLKNKQIKLSGREIEELFTVFLNDIERIVNIVDKI